MSLTEFKKILSKVFFLGTVLFMLSFTQDVFKKAQMKHSRVKTAYEEKWANLQKTLKDKEINPADFEIYIRAFKYDKKMEIWARNISSDLKYKLIKTYNVCETSGDLGPKRTAGDGQIPEGFYEIDVLNPTSKYHLSLHVNYPNLSDRVLGDKKNPGGNITIHGGCEGFGCLPINDSCIKEVYVLSVEAKNHGYKIPIDIYPCNFTNANYEMLKKNYSPELLKFWEELYKGYVFFEKKKYTGTVSIDKTGNYSFKD